MQDEYVVLVDENDREIGQMLKSEVHSDKTPLHRAFSVFVFNKEGKLLVTQRAKTKKTWPGVWSNSFCGHTRPGETREEAIIRRGKEELGVEVRGVSKVADYKYRFERNGVVENELCPVYRGIVGVQGIAPNPEEVEDYKWMTWEDFLKELERDTQNIWSEWCKEEVKLFG